MTTPVDAELTAGHEIPRMDFEAYRQLCDEQANSFRKTGILEEESYQGAIQDNRTQWLEIPSGSVPLFVHSDWTSGYDVPRIQQITGKDEVYLMGVPTSGVDSPIEGAEALKGAAIIVETDHTETEEAKQKLVELCQTAGFSAHDFIDHRLEADHPEHATAWMGLYETTIVPQTVKDPEVPTGDIKAAFNKLTGGELRPEKGDALYNADDYRANPEILEDLWGLFQTRFSWLGDNHPVSMEDTREMFEGLVLSEGAFSTLRFEDGKLVCAGLFIDNATDCDWLTPGINQQMQRQAEAEEAVPVYYAGIAASGENNHFMEGLVDFYCRLKAMAGTKDNLYFESSNMSSVYIPAVVQDYVAKSDAAELEDGVKQVARQDYWYLAR